MLAKRVSVDRAKEESVRKLLKSAIANRLSGDVDAIACCLFIVLLGFIILSFPRNLEQIVYIILVR
jgi:hypothetical protein